MTTTTCIGGKHERSKGPLIKIIGRKGEKPTIIRNNKEVEDEYFDQCAKPKCSTYTERVGPNEILIIRQEQDERDHKLTKTVIVKGILFALCLAACLFLLYKYCMNYSKSRETLAVFLLLLFTLVMFDPTYFIPKMAINSLRCPDAEYTAICEEKPCFMSKRDQCRR